MEGISSCQSRQDLLQAAIILAPELTRHLRRKGVSASDAQDLMQEVYIRILRIRSLRGIDHPRAYLYKVATSVAYEDRIRRLVRATEVALDELTLEYGASETPGALESGSAEMAATLVERLEGLSERLSELSPKVRDAVLWHHRDGYTCDEIAEKLSAATHRVKKYLVRGLAYCREAAPSTEPA